ncbi:MAG: methyltransferase domain-containing protein [Ignavibacteriales bacterium]|nr:methyltransferase domain-containing protein [Ignavibacteriales bacterium]
MNRNIYFKKTEKLVSKAQEVYQEKGVGYAIYSGIKMLLNWITNPLSYHYAKLFKSSKTFLFQGINYNYFIHKYNTPWKNERAVEVPIIMKNVDESKGKIVLEIGNVLSHYYSFTHDIVDKYDVASGVINQDVCDFQTAKKYDLIISISTLEHVGWDENPRDPKKILHAIDNLKSLLAPGGKIIVTLPLGYNPEMDKLLNESKIKFSKVHFLKRISRNNIWIEANWTDVSHTSYDYSFMTATGLVVGIIE